MELIRHKGYKSIKYNGFFIKLIANKGEPLLTVRKGKNTLYEYRGHFIKEELDMLEQVLA